MLAYSRSKSVGVQARGDDIRVVSGVLEDELYAMQCELAINRRTMTLETVQTRMKRFTTYRCVRAEDVFTRAEGWKIDADLEARIKKELGRKGCRHMAVLMVDCIRSFACAEAARELRGAMEKDPALDKGLFLSEFARKNPVLAAYLGLRPE